MISEEYYLQLRPGGSILTVHCSQYDEVNNMYTFYLLYGNSRFNDNGYTAKVSGTKPDKKGFEYAATFHYYSGSGSGDPSYAYVTINLKQQMTCVPGPVRCKLELSKTGGDFFTAPFILMVDAAGLADDVDISETVLPDYIDAAQRAAQEAASYVDSSEAWARGTRDGVPVTQGDETYQNNSKYYAEQSAAQVSLAEAQAQAASESATAAGNSVIAATSQVENAEAYARGTRGGTPVSSSDVTYHNNSKYYSEQASDSAAAAAASVAQGTQVEFWVQGGILYVQQTIQGVQQPAVALGSVTSPNTDYTFTTIAEMNTAIGNDEVIPGAMCYVAESGGFIFRNESGTAVCYASLQTVGTRASGSTVGLRSFANGYSVTASGGSSYAGGQQTIASGANAHAEGLKSEATGENAHAEGGGNTDIKKTVASAESSHAEGIGTTASGISSHAEGGRVTASAQNSHAEGNQSTAEGLAAHAEGYNTIAHAASSHAEGSQTVANGNYSHAEGSNTVARYDGCHAEGVSTIAGDSDNSGSKYAHAEGNGSHAYGAASHAEGQNTVASGSTSHAEGTGSTASGTNAHAEGNTTVASASYAHAEGYKTVASNYGAHAEGYSVSATPVTASGYASHAEGYATTASADSSHAEGKGTLASAACQHAGGSYNVEKTEAGNYMVIGNGTASARSNCFRVYTTAVYGNGAYNSSGADYAEYFEWLDGNEGAEDRAGRFVTLDGDKIRLANANDDFILGIVSGNASVIGDSHDDQWAHMYERDIFGRFIFEDVEIPAITEQIDEDHTEILVPAHMEHRLKLNPAYDNTQTYLPRSQRSEWDAVGMVGKLVALDDGTCQVNGYCAPGDGGIATASEDKTRYRVIKRLGEYHIQIVIV